MTQTASNPPQAAPATAPARARRLLRSSPESRLSMLQELGGVHPFEWDAGGDSFVAGPGLHALLGVEADAPVTLDSLLARVPAKDRPRVAARARELLASPQPFEDEFRLVAPDGSLCWLMVRGRSTEGAAEEEGGIAGVIIDITQRKAVEKELIKREAELRESVANFETLADAMPQMIWSTRPDGHHDYYNARWYEFTGVPEGSTDGQAWNGMFHPEDQDGARAKWRHCLATGEPYEIEYRLRHHSGEFRWVLGRAMPVRDAAGRITRWFGTCTDIHDTKRSAEYVELLSHELSHRIKNIFAIIQSLIGLSRRRFPEAAAFSADLQQRIAALGRAHDFARPHSEASRPQQGATTLQALAREILRPYPSMQEGRIVISGEDVPIDDKAATPFALILHELATNAKKYGSLSRNGHVSIETGCAEGTCTIVWTELGGPRVAGEPPHRGFGTRLATVSVESHLNGTMRREWLPSGLRVTVTCPETSLRRSPAAPG